MKKLIVGIVAALLICAPMVLADDAKPATTEVAKPSTATPATATPAEEGEAPVPYTDVVDENPAQYIVEMVKAFQSKNWTLGIGMALMTIIWGIRRFVWKSLPTKTIPWVSAGLALVATFAVSIIGGDIVWWECIISALTSSAGAVFLWEALFKHIALKKT